MKNKFIYLIPFILLSCSSGQLRYYPTDHVSEEIEYIKEGGGVGIDFSIPSDETKNQEFKTIDSLITSGNLTLQEVKLQNNSKSALKTFTVRIESVISNNKKVETKVYTLYPGQEISLGYNYFGVMLYSVNGNDVKTHYVLGEKKFDIVGSVDK